MSYYLRGKLIPKGERGYSAYEIAVQHGFIGTEEEWLASLEAGESASIVQEIASTSSNATIPSTLAVYNHVNGIETSIEGDIGDLSELETTETDSLVEAINEVQGEVGDLSDLDTTNQTSLVNAINEVYGIASVAEVVETGYANGGRYLKFSSGVMICWSTFNKTFIATTASGSLYRGSVTLGTTPAAFITNPTVFTMGLSLNFISAGIADVTPSTYGTLTFYTTGSTGSAGYGGYVSVLGLGRWK